MRSRSPQAPLVLPALAFLAMNTFRVSVRSRAVSCRASTLPVHTERHWPLNTSLWSPVTSTGALVFDSWAALGPATASPSASVAVVIVSRLFIGSFQQDRGAGATSSDRTARGRGPG